MNMNNKCLKALEQAFFIHNHGTKIALFNKQKTKNIKEKFEFWVLKIQCLKTTIQSSYQILKYDLSVPI